MSIVPDPVKGHRLRHQCVCGSTTGMIRERNGQDCVYCDGCSKWLYNAPRTETGRAVRTLASRPAITPSQRAHVMASHDYACVGCGRRAPEVRLELDHIISRELADAYGLLDALIDSHWNLAPMCAECNSGKRWVSEPQVRLMYRCLMMKAQPK